MVTKTYTWTSIDNNWGYLMMLKLRLKDIKHINEIKEQYDGEFIEYLLEKRKYKEIRI